MPIAFVATVSTTSVFQHSLAMTNSIETKQTEVSHFETTDDAAPNSNEIGVLKTLLSHPKIIALCLFANLGALMYGFDNLALSLCLSTVPFQ